MGPIGEEVVAHRMSFVFLSVPILDELINSNKVLKTRIEFSDAVVGLALLGKELQVLLVVGDTCLCCVTEWFILLRLKLISLSCSFFY